MREHAKMLKSGYINGIPSQLIAHSLLIKITVFHYAEFVDPVTGTFHSTLFGREKEAREQASKASADRSIFPGKYPGLALSLQRGTFTSLSHYLMRFSRYFSRYSVGKYKVVNTTM